MRLERLVGCVPLQSADSASGSTGVGAASLHLPPRVPADPLPALPVVFRSVCSGPCCRVTRVWDASLALLWGTLSHHVRWSNTCPSHRPGWRRRELPRHLPAFQGSVPSRSSRHPSGCAPWPSLRPLLAVGVHVYLLFMPTHWDEFCHLSLMPFTMLSYSMFFCCQSDWVSLY